MKVGEKVLLKHPAFKGKHKIQNRWENTIYQVIEQPLGKLPVFKIKSMEGDNKMKVVHQNLLLLLLSDPSDLTNELDSKSVVDQNVDTHGVVAVSAVASHVHNMSASSRAQVASLFQQGLQFVTTLLSSVKHYDLIDSIISWIQSDMNVLY